MKSTWVAIMSAVGILFTSSLAAAPAGPVLVSPHYQFNIPWLEAPIEGDLQLQGSGSGTFFLAIEGNPSFCGNWQVQGNTLTAAGVDCYDTEGTITFTGRLTAGGAFLAGTFEMTDHGGWIKSLFGGSALP